eukprot:gene311-570_t
MHTVDRQTLVNPDGGECAKASNSLYLVAEQWGTSVLRRGADRSTLVTVITTDLGELAIDPLLTASDKAILRMTCRSMRAKYRECVRLRVDEAMFVTPSMHLFAETGIREASYPKWKMQDDVRHFCTETVRPLLPAASPLPAPAPKMYLCFKNLDVRVLNLSTFVDSVECVDLEKVDGDFESVCRRLDDKMIVIFVHLMFTD